MYPESPRSSSTTPSTESLTSAAFEADPSGPLGQDILAATLGEVRRKKQRRAIASSLTIVAVTLGTLNYLVPQLNTPSSNGITETSTAPLPAPSVAPRQSPAPKCVIKIFQSSPTDAIKIFSSTDSPASIETIDDAGLLALISKDSESNGGGILVTSTGRKMVFASDSQLP